MSRDVTYTITRFQIFVHSHYSILLFLFLFLFFSFPFLFIAPCRINKRYMCILCTLYKYIYVCTKAPGPWNYYGIVTPIMQRQRQLHRQLVSPFAIRFLGRHRRHCPRYVIVP